MKILLSILIYIVVLALLVLPFQFIAVGHNTLQMELETKFVFFPILQLLLWLFISWYLVKLLWQKMDSTHAN